MTEKLIFSCLFIGVMAFASKSYAQTSSEAVMNAKVRIVHAAGVHFEKNSAVNITQVNKNNFNVGSLKMHGTDYTAIFVPKNIEIVDMIGKKVRLGVRTIVSEIDGAGNSKTLKLSGYLTDHFPPGGLYRGKLSVSIEHL